MTVRRRRVCFTLSDEERGILEQRARASGTSASYALGTILRALNGPIPEDPRVTAKKLERDAVKIREEQRTARKRWGQLQNQETCNTRFAIARINHASVMALAGATAVDSEEKAG